MQETHTTPWVVPLTELGRTDRAIIHDLFRAMDIPVTAGHYEQFVDRYHDCLDGTMNAADGYLLEGALPLLQQVAEIPNVAIGLLTGNSRQAAQIKTTHFGIEQFFHFGGYGQEFADRNEVAHAALADCRRWAQPRKVDPLQAWVIGDTVNDIRCARAIGANVIGVATGGSARNELEQAGADVVLDDLKIPDPILDVCRGLHSGPGHG